MNRKLIQGLYTKYSLVEEFIEATFIVTPKCIDI